MLQKGATNPAARGARASACAGFFPFFFLLSWPGIRLRQGSERSAALNLCLKSFPPALHLISESFCWHLSSCKGFAEGGTGSQAAENLVQAPQPWRGLRSIFCCSFLGLGRDAQGWRALYISLSGLRCTCPVSNVSPKYPPKICLVCVKKPSH